MKIFVIILIFGLTLTFISWKQVEKKEVLKNFSGGREMYSYTTLELLNDSTYQLSEWYHNGGTELDSGNWRLLDTLLILNSFSPSIKKHEHITTRKERKELKIKEKFILKYDTNYRFVNDTFLYIDSIVYLFDFDELENELDSSFYLLYLSLHEQKLK